MIKKCVQKEIDRVIKETWMKNIQADYHNEYMLKEDSLKCCFYYHLRRKLARIMEENNLRIYPEYYFKDLHYRADIAIVQIDPYKEVSYLADKVVSIAAIIELKYVAGSAENVASWVKDDVWKMKNYINAADEERQYYFSVIYETECSSLNWMDKRSTNNWASGSVTELNAGYLDEQMVFEVHSYNGMNPTLNTNGKVE